MTSPVPRGRGTEARTGFVSFPVRAFLCPAILRAEEFYSLLTQPVPVLLIPRCGLFCVKEVHAGVNLQAKESDR